MNKYVNNIWEFVKHINAHRKRVSLLASVLDSRWQARYVYRLHDIEKYLFLPWLWKYYAGDGDRRKAKSLYTLMNKVGRLLLSMLSFWINKAELAEIQKCEKLADVVDRQMDPVAEEEFQRIRPIEKFVSDDDLEIARFLMSKYEQVTGQHHSYYLFRAQR